MFCPTFVPFNFFQQPNTGQGAKLPYDTYPDLSDAELVRKITHEDAGRSGAVADFNWFYPYAGTNIRYSLIEADTAFRRFYLLSEIEKSEYGSGLYILNMGNGLSGKFLPSWEQCYFNSTFQAQLDPQFSDPNLIENYTSGTVKSGVLGFSSINSAVSGRVSGRRKSECFTSYSFSGNFQSGIEFGFINSNLTGIISGCQKDEPKQSNTLSGSFYHSLKDNFASISFGLSGMDVLVNGVRYVYAESGDKVVSVKFGLVSYIANNNV